MSLDVCRRVAGPAGRVGGVGGNSLPVMPKVICRSDDCHRSVAASLLVVVLLGATTAGSAAAPDAYRSPYSVKFSYPLGELIGDIQHGARGEPRKESSVPFADWYSRHTRRQFGAWGPPSHHFHAAPEAVSHPIDWQRERVIAVALRFQGYDYQHHHIPDWAPPPDWPWKETKAGHNGKGIDCSNFTSFVYNLGFGFKLSGAVKKQAEELKVSGPGAGRVTRVKRIELPKTYAERVQTLQTGDLLFIRNVHGEISHVVLWVGSIGQAPDSAPLILDSHGANVRDSQGSTIPSGVHLRPFLEQSWYSHSASHAIRILHEQEKAENRNRPLLFCQRGA